MTHPKCDTTPPKKSILLLLMDKTFDSNISGTKTLKKLNENSRFIWPIAEDAL
jgi:hypothetical protein